MLVIVVATVAMTTAEFISYWAGGLGRSQAEKRQINIGGRLGRWLRKIVRSIDWLMVHAGAFTLFLLSALPNPFFEFAGLAAGASRISFLKFTLAVGLGHLVRVALLVNCRPGTDRYLGFR